MIARMCSISSEPVTFDQLDLLAIGNTIQLAGAVWTGEGRTFVVPLPDEELTDIWEVLNLDGAEWERFLNQSDVLEVQGPGKAVLRKSQRQIDQWMAWRVFERDGYRCRYCGAKAPLTVDHVILWENGGATVEDNLVSACKKCNKTRGNMEYEAWIDSGEYMKRVGNLSPAAQNANEDLVRQLDKLRAITAKPRSR